MAMIPQAIANGAHADYAEQRDNLSAVVNGSIVVTLDCYSDPSLPDIYVVETYASRNDNEYLTAWNGVDASCMDVVQRVGFDNIDEARMYFFNAINEHHAG